MSRGAPIGMEVIKLDEHDPRAPWRMTIDAFEDGEIVRYQVTGLSFERRKRLVSELAAVQADYARRYEIAQRLDELDREYGEKINALSRELYRAQVEVIYGQEGLDLLDSDED